MEIDIIPQASIRMSPWYLGYWSYWFQTCSAMEEGEISVVDTLHGACHHCPWIRRNEGTSVFTCCEAAGCQSLERPVTLTRAQGLSWNINSKCLTIIFWGDTKPNEPGMHVICGIFHWLQPLHWLGMYDMCVLVMQCVLFFLAERHTKALSLFTHTAVSSLPKIPLQLCSSNR